MSESRKAEAGAGAGAGANLHRLDGKLRFRPLLQLDVDRCVECPRPELCGTTSGHTGRHLLCEDICLFVLWL